MQPLAGVADALGQKLLDIHVDILIIEGKLHIPLLDILEDSLQPFDDFFRLVRLDDALPAQHGRMRDRTGDVFLI